MAPTNGIYDCDHHAIAFNNAVTYIHTGRGHNDDRACADYDTDHDRTTNEPDS